MYKQKGGKEMKLQVTELPKVDPKSLQLLEGNRKLDPRHIERIKKALQERNLLHVKAVIVTPDGKIIDGQYRREAAIQNGIDEIPCIVVKAGLTEAQILNQNNKNWVSFDFAESFAGVGNKDYQIFVEFKNKYKFDTGSCIMLLQGDDRKAKMGNMSGASFIDFKEGRFKVKDLQRGTRLADIIMSFQKSLPDIYKCRYFVRAVMRMATTKGYNHKTMTKKINGRLLPKCMDTKDYLRMLQETYNKSTPKSKRLLFIPL
jgi:hypothetical protein